MDKALLVLVLANNRFLTDVLCSFSNRPTEDSNKLVSIKPDLDPVVEQGEEGSKRESCHKDGHEPVLDHWTGQKNTKKQIISGLHGHILT